MKDKRYSRWSLPSPRIILLVLGLTTTIANTHAREIRVGAAAKEGMSSERLQRLTDHMAAEVTKGTMVGGLGVIARNGKVVYSQTWGQADRESGRVMQEDALFRIYSMSKPITSAALMMLYEEGKFFLNDPIARYIPELANLQVAKSTADGDTKIVSDGTTSRTLGEGDKDKVGETRAPARQPTIRDLMTHTAGFTYGVFGNTEVDQQYREAGILFDHPDLKDFVTKLGAIPLQYEPGSRWHYSISVDIQGRLVEVISGMKFSEFLQKRMFRPLDMPDTFFVVPDDKLDRLAQLYAPKGTPKTPNAFLSPNTSDGLEVAGEFANRGFLKGATFEGGGGGLVSTARDYLRFSQMMLNGGELDGVRLLSTKSVELMTMNHLGELPMGFGRSGYGFGLGFAVSGDQGLVGELGSAGEYNWGGAAGTRFWVDPEENLIGIFMVQSLPHRTRLGSEFKTLTYQAIVD